MNTNDLSNDEIARRSRRVAPIYGWNAPLVTFTAESIKAMASSRPSKIMQRRIDGRMVTVHPETGQPARWIDGEWKVTL